MAEKPFDIFDRVQFEQSQMRDRLTILEARVAALESGRAVPPELKPEITPTLPPPQPVPQEHVETAPETPPIPDISLGWVGGRRG